MSVSEITSLIAACASLLTAVAVLVGLVLTLRGQREIHAEVKTVNGITSGLLLERTEGRRIEADLSPGERTESEQGYVDRLRENGGR